jgi:phosphatidylserine synthase 2
MMMSFILFQKKDNVREWLGLLDHNLGSPLPERSYAEDCSLNYDAITSQLDIFVLAHTLGWFAKAIILRDVWFCWVLSIMFEIMEYSLQHQLPNFAECWWDHWVLDVLLTNWLGLYLGMKTCEYFEVKKYSWRGNRT